MWARRYYSSRPISAHRWPHMQPIAGLHGLELSIRQLAELAVQWKTNHRLTHAVWLSLMITIRHEPRYLTYVQQNSPMPYQYNQVALELYTETSKYRLFITNADRHAVGLFCFLLVWRFAGFSLNSRKITERGSICMCMRLRIWK